MFEKIKQFDINKLFVGVLFFSIGATLALILNLYIEYRFFSLPPEVIKPVQVEKKPVENYQDISLIFRKKEKQIQVVKEEKGKKEKKILSSGTSVGNISLIGTLVLDRQKYALIKAGKESKIVKVGSLVNGFKVEEIGKYFIILSKGGNRYKLSVKISTAGTKLTSKSFRKKEEKLSKNIQKEVFRLDRRFVQEQTADIGSILKDVYIVPVVRNGETVGFKFRYVKPGSLLYKYGLRSGDLILSVNGRPVRTVEEAFKIYNILRNEDLVQVEIERRGKRKVLVYEIH